MIFFDMDGVLCDFNSAAKKLIFNAGLPMPDEDDWHYLSNPMYKEQVNHIATSQCFWRKLEVFPEAIEAFNLAREYSMILSCPQFFVSATPKLEWCNKHLGLKTDKIILTSAKHHLAGPGKWLIDDKSSNCQSFAEAGGSAVLVEHPYSYKDGSVTKETLHRRVLTAKMPELPDVVHNIKACFYG